MNGAEIWSVIKTVGSLGGLISAAFLIWDRATKSRPYARFLQDDDYDIPEKNRVILRVHNPSDRLILARAGNSSSPQDLFLSADDETFMRADIYGIMAIKPGGFVDMHVMRQDGWEVLPDNGMVRAVFRWKYAQPIVFRSWRTERLMIEKQDYDAISPCPRAS